MLLLTGLQYSAYLIFQKSIHSTNTLCKKQCIIIIKIIIIFNKFRNNRDVIIINVLKIIIIIIIIYVNVSIM